MKKHKAKPGRAPHTSPPCHLFFPLLHVERSKASGFASKAVDASLRIRRIFGNSVVVKTVCRGEAIVVDLCPGSLLSHFLSMRAFCRYLTK